MYATITVPDSLDEKSPQSSLCMAGKELYKPCPDVSFTQVSVTNSSINGLHYLAYHMGNNAKVYPIAVKACNLPKSSAINRLCEACNSSSNDSEEQHLWKL